MIMEGSTQFKKYEPFNGHSVLNKQKNQKTNNKPQIKEDFLK